MCSSDLARTVLLPGLEHNARAWIGGVTVPNDLASAYGFAAAALHRGGDGIYLFNWMDSQTRPVTAEDYAHLLRTGFTPADYEAWSARMLADGEAFVVPTAWKGETVLRLCLVNPRTTLDDLRLIFDSLA